MTVRSTTDRTTHTVPGNTHVTWEVRVGEEPYKSTVTVWEERRQSSSTTGKGLVRVLHQRVEMPGKRLAWKVQ